MKRTIINDVYMWFSLNLFFLEKSTNHVYIYIRNNTDFIEWSMTYSEEKLAKLRKINTSYMLLNTTFLHIWVHINDTQEISTSYNEKN